MNRLEQKFKSEIQAQLIKDLGIENPNLAPALDKIVVNAGVGRATQDSKYLETVISTLEKVTGQKPVVTKARHSIASFKLREGNDIGAKVTLRGEYMWNFLDRLIAVVIPRMRDFRGLSKKSFDPQGNYSIGISDQTIFPEISFEEANSTHGLQINIITKSRNKADSEAFLRALGLPLEKGEK